MRRWKTTLLSALTSGVILYLLCNRAPISGPSTEEGNPQIVAVVVDNHKKPVEGATVIVYNISPYTDTLQVPSVAIFITANVTDRAGCCELYNLPSGVYTIIAKCPTSDHSAFRSGITINETALSYPSIDTLILNPPGGFRGVVTRGGVAGNVQSQNVNLRDAAIMVIIQEAAYSMITPPNGEYSFSGLPVGIYTVIYYATDGFFSARRIVDVEAGRTILVDTVVLKPLPRLLPPKGFSLFYDTVEASVSISWNPLLFDSLRWYEAERIDLTGPYDTVFTTTDTILADYVGKIPAGTTLNYVVHSVDRAFNKSMNAGPLKIIVSEKH